MQLIGMLDSPYVRRTAISLQLLDIAFTSQPISVFSAMDAFRAINPVIKAPTLVAADGTVLMDSNLILDYAETLAGPARSLWPLAAHERLRALRLTGLALAACEKAVQIVYEHRLRPAEKLHQPWLDRVQAQLLAALDALELELRAAPPPAAAGGQPLGQAGVTLAVAWSFMQWMVPDRVPAERFASQAAFAQQAEALPVFRDWPQA